MDNDKQLDNLESQLDVLERKEKTKFWVRIVGWSLLTLAVIVGTVVVVRMMDRLDKIDQRLEQHIDACVSDSISALQRGDVYELVGKATQESLNSYIDSQGTFLTVLAALITVLVALIGIAVPLLTNKGLSDRLRSDTRKSKKEVTEKMNEELEKGLNKLSEEKQKEVASLIQLVERQSQNLTILQSDIEKILTNKQAMIEHAESLKQVREESDVDKKIKRLKEEIVKSKDTYPAEGYYELGKLYKSKGDYDHAVSNFRIAIYRLPDFAEAYHELAKTQCIVDNPDYKSAWKNIEKAMGLQPSNPAILKTRCEIFEKMGAFEAAMNDAERGEKMAEEEGDGDLMTAFGQMKNQLSSKVQGDGNNEEIISVGKETIRMVRVRKGAFTMGATPEQGEEAFVPEKPAHRVLLGDYYIGDTVVTQALWRAVMGDNPSRFKGDNRPVERVTWNEVTQKFIPELNRRTGCTFRLPTEAEWEFAARGGNKTKNFRYSGSDNVDDVAWYWKNSGDRLLEGTDADWSLDIIVKNNGKTHPVKGKKPNELGLYDMSGNVFEWCQDWFREYSGDLLVNPTGSESGRDRVCRGGGWNCVARGCRVACRRGDNPGKGSDIIGFRLALTTNFPQEEGKKA